MHALLSFSEEEMVLEYLADCYCKHFIVNQLSPLLRLPLSRSKVWPLFWAKFCLVGSNATIGKLVQFYTLRMS